MDVVMYLAEAFLVAYAMRLIAFRFKVPAVSAYVVGGVILGGSLFFALPGGEVLARRWLFSESALENLVFITRLALGAIALSIGAELEWSRIKALGKSIVAIAICEAFGAFFIVGAITWLIWRDFPLAFILGAVSSATAPAATVSVIQQYRARGPLANTILAVVGIDDAISFIIFAFALAVTQAVLKGRTIDFVSGVGLPLYHVGVAIVLGCVIGFIGARLMMLTKDHDTVVFLLGAIILWTTGIAGVLGVSELLANMASGVVIVNSFHQLKNKMRSVFSHFMPVFYALFFITGGAHLDITVLPAIWMLAIVYFLLRSTGKIAGAYGGAWIARAPKKIRSLTGLALLPQVGAAIALALVVQQTLGDGSYGERGIILAETTINVLLVTTILTEFVGPYFTKRALFKAGEAQE